MPTNNIFKTAFSTRDYYKSMNEALKSLNGNYHMLHYPLYSKESDSFAKAQENLIDHCLNKLPSIRNKKILDIGCGNGTVSLYIAENYDIHEIEGVDLNDNNIKIANREKKMRGCKKSGFNEGDAQDLRHINDNSIDVVICIESAFHYPDKESFLKEINRILKPGGEFVIADILTTRKGSSLLGNWKKSMNFNHWSLSHYSHGFKVADLTLYSREDISEHVILGFKAYKNYLEGFNSGNLIKSWLLKMFFIINARLNIHLLKRKRKYYIFHGVREN